MTCNDTQKMPIELKLGVGLFFHGSDRGVSVHFIQKKLFLYS